MPDGSEPALPAALLQWPLAAQAMAQGRCRIGLVSADFRTHATGLLLVQTLAALDRSRFELLLYSPGADDGTPLQARIQAAADRFVDCRPLSLAAQARQIRADGVTILIDLSGYTTDSRPALFALRPAPLQAVWLAYPVTLGAPWIDYLIAEPVFSRWCRILQRVPGSVLWLLLPQAEIGQALRARAAERGIAADRLVFAPFVTTTEHLPRLPLADVFLDTFPYGAHTTCSDALWMGLPVLTQVGRSFASRVAASLLRAVGLPELAVDKAEDYEEIAVRLAQDRQALGDIRDHLRDNRRDLPLFDNPRLARELGDVLARMASRWQQGQAPQAMPVD